MVWVFHWLELHLVTTGQCYSVDVLGFWGLIGSGRNMFVPADSQHLPYCLAAASMMAEVFVSDWLTLKFRQGRQNLILCREGPLWLFWALLIWNEQCLGSHDSKTSLFYRDCPVGGEDNICLRISGLLCIYVPSAHLLRNVEVFLSGQVCDVSLLWRAALLSGKGTPVPGSIISHLKGRSLFCFSWQSKYSSD